VLEDLCLGTGTSVASALTAETIFEIVKCISDVDMPARGRMGSKSEIFRFLPARRYASAGLCDSDVSVCPSVCHTPVLCLAERKQDREMYTV